MSVDPDEYDGPVFGEGVLLTTPIRLVVHGPGDPPEGRQEQFNAMQDMDAGLLIGVVNARTQQQEVAAALRLLLHVMVDSDGLSSDYEPPLVEAGDKRIKTGKVAEGDVDVEHPDYDERLEDRADWSSLRRLENLLDDPKEIIALTALLDLSKYMVEQAGGGRPTGPSRPSSTGPRRTGRGSAARRS